MQPDADSPRSPLEAADERKLCSGWSGSCGTSQRPGDEAAADLRTKERHMMIEPKSDGVEDEEGSFTRPVNRDGSEAWRGGDKTD